MKWLMVFVSPIIMLISLNRARQASIIKENNLKSEAEQSHPTEM